MLYLMADTRKSFQRFRRTETLKKYLARPTGNFALILANAKTKNINETHAGKTMAKNPKKAEACKAWRKRKKEEGFLEFRAYVLPALYVDLESFLQERLPQSSKEGEAPHIGQTSPHHPSTSSRISLKSIDSPSEVAPAKARRNSFLGSHAIDDTYGDDF